MQPSSENPTVAVVSEESRGRSLKSKDQSSTEGSKPSSRTNSPALMNAEAYDPPEPTNPVDENQSSVGLAANQAHFPETSGQPNEGISSLRDPTSLPLNENASKPTSSRGRIS